MMRIQLVVARGSFAIVALTICVTTVVAQSGKLPNPADPGAAASAMKYESAFSDYQPFREQKINSWKEVNQVVADNPGMGPMGSMKDMPGMDTKTGDASRSKEGAAGHDMGSMKEMPGMTKPDMDSKAGNAPKSKQGAADHNMGSMKDMPGMDTKTGNAPKNKQGATGHNMDSMKDKSGKTMPGMNKQAASAAMGKEEHGAMAMAKPQSALSESGNTHAAGVTGTGVVQAIDKANGKVKLTHDPIAALGWPRMTMFFRLKDSSLADQVKEGDKVGFFLEKSATGYVISGFQKGTASHDMKLMK